MNDTVFFIVSLLGVFIGGYGIGYRDGFRTGMKKVYFIIKGRELELE